MDTVQHKLFYFEAQPPAKLWDNIEAALDKEAEENYVQKLKAYEPNPPAYTWDKIETQLDENKTPVVPFSKRFSTVFKYGAAAIVLLVAVFIFTSKKPFAEKHKDIVTSGGQDTPGTRQNIQKPDAEDFATANSFYRTETKTPYVEERKDESLRPIARISLRTKPSTSLYSDDLIIPKNMPVVTSDMPERYIVFSKTTGEAVRLSKKLFDLFACADDTENCRENIEFAQQQMASPGATTSADFGGVLELLQNMNYQ